MKYAPPLWFNLLYAFLSQNLIIKPQMFRIRFHNLVNNKHNNIIHNCITKSYCYNTITYRHVFIYC